MPDDDCTWDPSTFSAMAIYTGENRIIRVDGSGTCRTGGWVHALEADNPGINPDPTELVLRIVSTPPEFGPDVITEVTVQGFFEAEQSVSAVVIRALDLRLEVKEPA